MRITIVTYLRSSETISDNFKKLVKTIDALKLLKTVCVFTAATPSAMPTNWQIFHDTGQTKYSRLKALIQGNDHELILSVDNDMDIDSSKVVDFYQKFISSNASIGWGRIGVANSGNVANMICVDKILSHCYIRPCLWRIGLGISVPGQCFILKTQDYRGILPEDDTFLDDLQIGLVTNINMFTVFSSSDCLGNENVKSSIIMLCSQRRRWANGFASVLKAASSLSCRHLMLTVIHGSAYHVIPPLVTLIVLYIAILSPWIGLVLGSFLLAVLTRLHLRLIPCAVGYLFFFPILHIYWGIYVTYYFCRNKG